MPRKELERPNPNTLVPRSVITVTMSPERTRQWRSGLIAKRAGPHFLLFVAGCLNAFTIFSHQTIQFLE